MVYKLKTDAETRAHVQLLMNFKGMRTENIFNKVNISRSTLYPIVKAQTVTGRLRIFQYLCEKECRVLHLHDYKNLDRYLPVFNIMFQQRVLVYSVTCFFDDCNANKSKSIRTYPSHKWIKKKHTVRFLKYMYSQAIELFYPRIIHSLRSDKTSLKETGFRLWKQSDILLGINQGIVYRLQLFFTRAGGHKIFYSAFNCLYFEIIIGSAYM